MTARRSSVPCWTHLTEEEKIVYDRLFTETAWPGQLCADTARRIVADLRHWRLERRLDRQLKRTIGALLARQSAPPDSLGR